MGYKGGFSKELHETSSCPKEPISAISKSGLALTKAKSVSNSGRMSETTNLRQKVVVQLQLEREARICESNNSVHSKVSGEGRGRRCSRHWSRDSPSVCGEDHGETGCVPASSQRFILEQRSTCSL